MLERFLCRLGPVVCLVALLSWPFWLYGAKGAFESNANNVLDWLPESFDETTRLIWFVQRFGSDEILVVSWPGCTLDDERLERFAQRLREPFQWDGGRKSAVLFRQVFTGRKTLEQLQDEPLNLSRDEALARLEGWLVGQDGETTCVVALVSDVGMASRSGALQAVYEAAESCGLQHDELRVGGPTADSVAIDRASQQWVLELTFLAMFWALLVAWWCLKRLHLVVFVFLAAAFAWSLSLSAVYYSGVNMDAVLLMMPALVYVLCTSGAIHLTNYYTDAVRSRGLAHATTSAISRGWLPCVLACGTTAIGLGSLALSQVTPITKFGVYSAVGVLLVMATLLTLWPSLVHWWSGRIGQQARQNRFHPQGSPGSTRRWWDPCFTLATRCSTVLLALTVVSLTILGFGLSRIQTSAKLEDLLPPGSELIRGYAWLQQQIGPLVPVEIVLRFQPGDLEDSPQLAHRVQVVEELRRRIDSMQHVGGTTAASTFIVDIPEGGGLRQVLRRTVIARQIRKDWDKLRQLRYIYVDEDEELWRVSTRVEALQGVDYGEFLARLEEQVDQFLEDERAASGTELSAAISGGIPLIYMAQQQLLRDLIKSFMTAFALIAVVMVALTGNPLAGLVSMIPNVFPALVIFGGMGLTATAIDIGAMMTASAALGIAVDDTLHFLVWFRRGLIRKPNRKGAIRYAYEHCATPMLQTTLICGLGLLVFALSPFTPVMRFAWLIALLLLLALLADLVLLPALLISPLGRFFIPSRRRQASES